MNSLNVEQIQEIIPHRHPFLLIDKIEDYVPGEYEIRKGEPEYTGRLCVIGTNLNEDEIKKLFQLA